MKNKITDLNNHLFAQLERLGDEDITPEQLDLEIKRSTAITEVSKTIIDSAKMTISAMKIMEQAGMKLDGIAAGFLPEKNEEK